MAGLVHPTLAAAAVIAAAAAVVYLHVGRRLALRPAAPEARLPLRMFALWWLATGANIIIACGFIAAAAFGSTSLPLQIAYGVVQRLLLALSLAGLMHYLLVLVRGRASMKILVLVYGALGFFLVAMLYANEPNGVYVGQWRTDLDYRTESPPLIGLVDLLWLVLPPVGLSVAAMVTARRLPPSQTAHRNRITLVSLAIIVWWIVAVLAGQRQAFGSEFFQVFNRFLGLSMALIVLVAYDTPSWLRRYITTPLDDAL